MADFTRHGGSLETAFQCLPRYQVLDQTSTNPKAVVLSSGFPRNGFFASGDLSPRAGSIRLPELFPFGRDHGGRPLGLDLRQLGFLCREQALDGPPLGLVQVGGRQQLPIMLDVQFGNGLVHR